MEEINSSHVLTQLRNQIEEHQIWERIKVENPKIRDENNNPITTIIQGERMQLSCDLTNMTNDARKFVYCVSVKDLDNVQNGFLWISGNIGKEQLFTPSLFWTPKQSGKHILTTYIFKNINYPELLTTPIDLELQVFV